MIQDLRGHNNWSPGEYKGVVNSEVGVAPAGGVKPGNTEGLKFDQGKPPMSLINRRAMEEEAKVLAFGARKYYEWNWAKGMKWSRLIDAMLRHAYAFADGEDVDPETGLSHLAHIRCCAGFLLDYTVSHPECDDRRRTGLPDVRDADGKSPVQAGVPKLPVLSKLQ